MKLKYLKVGFKETEEVAQHQLDQQKFGKKDRCEKYEIVKDLMKHKLVDAEKGVRECTEQLKQSKENLSKVVRERTLVRDEFMSVVNREISIVWDEGKVKNQEKTERLVAKFSKNEKDLEVHEGVFVGDEALEKLEVESGFTKDNRPAVYGGICNLTVDQEKVLKLPPNHRTYPKLNVENFKTELEKCIIKSNWQKQREERQLEEEHCKNENDGAKEASSDPVNDKENVIDFRNLKATDLKNNKRIILPNLEDDTEEIRKNNVKKELEGIFVNYMKEHCDKFGNQIENNLSKKEVNAIKALKTKMKDEDIVCFETDKTGKFALDTKTNYVRKMEKHVENDDIVSMKEVRKIEKKLNEHSEHIVNITNAGESNGHTKRIKSNLKSSDNQVPILSGTHKDHKNNFDEENGPDLRPIMGATVGPNVALSNFLAREILKKITEEASEGNDCESTEELLDKFEEYNKLRFENGNAAKNVFIASMDIDKWFPRMRPRPMAKEIRQMVIDSKLAFEGIDYDKIAKYLGEYMEVDEILSERFEEILYIDKHKTNELRNAKNKEALDTEKREGENVNTNGKEKMKEGNTLNTMAGGGEIANNVKENENGNGPKDAHGKSAWETVQKEKELDDSEHGNVTFACDDDQEKEAHKESAKNVNTKNRNKKEIGITLNTMAGGGDNVDIMNKEQMEMYKAHQKSAQEIAKNIMEINETKSGDATLVNDDEKRNKAHKTPGSVKEDKVLVIPPTRNPNELEKRSMLSKMMEIMILVVMENHVYKFGDTIRKQKDGGPIGLALTGEIADCYLVNWDKKLKRKLQTVGIDLMMYERYKDDITVIGEVLETGSRLVNDKITIDLDKKVEDSEKSNSEVTMNIVVEVAESIDNMIKFSVDLPEKNPSKKLAVLDLEVNINKTEGNRVDYEFYEKPSKNNRVLLEDAALPSKQKRTILTQECLRRLRNTKVELGKETQVKHLNKFMLKMKNSGYSAKYRKEILDSALRAFEHMLAEDSTGKKPLFRNREWKKEERKKFKLDRKINWYKNPAKGRNEIEYKSVLFVPVTKGGKLAKEMKAREEEINRYSKDRIKIVEGGGVQMKTILVKKNPFPTQRCEKKKCLLCDTNVSTEISIPCNSHNVGYQLVCDTCRDRGVDKVYEGETSRSARVRGAEHSRDFKKGAADSALYKHKQNEHRNEEMTFSMKITKRFSDPLSRQANEAARISSRGKYDLLNSKNEFNHPPIARISVEKNVRTPRTVKPGL